MVLRNKNNTVKVDDGRVIVTKLLSKDDGYHDAPTEGIRRVIEQVIGISVPISAPVPTKNIESIRMGTTVATNALLERKGVPTLLCITKGFSDLLRIGCFPHDWG